MWTLFNFSIILIILSVIFWVITLKKLDELERGFNFIYFILTIVFIVSAHVVVLLDAILKAAVC